MIKQEFEKLNNKQREAVETIYWPIMVVAWPWTWKTQIIALRTANILEKTNINPNNILITTFTEAWVIAIRKRLTEFIWTTSYKVWISTIHSFAQDVITSFPEKFIEERAWSTIDEIESFEILTKIIDENISNWNLKELYSDSERYFYLRDIKDRISKLKGEWVNNIEFEKIIQEQENKYSQNLEELKHNKRIRDLEKRTNKDKESYDKHILKLRELNLIYKKYNEVLKENSLYDFSDMINFVMEKFKIDKDLLSYYAEKYQFIMLDEYQDSNNPQNKIMDLILELSDEKNIMVVWDDDQSIYRFQWANIENMLDFYNKYPQTKFVVLEDNYRSNQEILDISTKLIKNNNERLVNRLKFLEKNLISKKENSKINPKFYILNDEQTEKAFTLNEIKKINKKENIAIIVRNNKEVFEWTNFMQLENIEVESKLKTNILNNKFVEFLINFLNIIKNPYYNDEIFINILRTDLVDIDNIDVINLTKELYNKNYSRNWFKLWIWDIIKKVNLDDENYLNSNKIVDFKNLILNLNSELWTYWLSKLFQKIVEKINIINYIEQNANFSDLEDIFTLFNKIKEINEKNKDIDINKLLNKFELHKKYNISIPRQILKKSWSNIEILTAHSAKWLEYDFVFIPWVYSWNWDNKKIPNKLKLPFWVSWDWLQFSNYNDNEIKKLEDEINTEEDRRLFFVAITRAKKWLIFTRPSWKENKPYLNSSFIEEIWIIHEENSNFDYINNIDSIKNQLLISNDLIKITNDEINYISDFLQNYKLSPTDLNMFLEDPKIFLQNVIFKYPFIDNEFTIFWKIYHRVLELATAKKSNQEEVELKFFIETFNYLLDKQILTYEEKIRLQEKWIEWLKWYYNIFKQNKNIVLKTEYNFRSRNIVFKWIPITWKIDKIEKLETQTFNNTSNEFQSALFKDDVAIIDYKTWKIKSIWEIKWIDRYWNQKESFENWKYYRQLLFYKLLAENDSEFNSNYNIKEVALDFVEWKNDQYKYLVIELNNEDFENFKILLKDSREKINNINFWKELLKK